MTATPTTNRPRRSLTLQGTSRKTTADMDFSSLAALQYAQAWAINRRDRKASLSLILRRALAVYVAHLEAITHADGTPPLATGLYRALAAESAGSGGE